MDGAERVGNTGMKRRDYHPTTLPYSVRNGLLERVGLMSVKCGHSPSTAKQEGYPFEVY